MAETKYTYSILDDTVDDKVDAGELTIVIVASDISTVLSHINTNGDDLDIFFVDALSAGDITTLTGIVNAHAATLIDAKRVKKEAILEKTEEKIGEGIFYDDHYFSVTPSAKTNWLGLTIAKDSLTYPHSVPTGFDHIYEFADASEIEAFFGTGMAFIQYWEQSNEQLFIAVDACTTVSEVDAIVDNRTYP